MVGEAVDGWDAIDQAKELKPDIVLIDLEMPGLDGFEATRRIKELNLAKTVIIHTFTQMLSTNKKLLKWELMHFLLKAHK